MLAVQFFRELACFIRGKSTDILIPSVWVSIHEYPESFEYISIGTISSSHIVFLIQDDQPQGSEKSSIQSDSKALNFSCVMVSFGRIKALYRPNILCLGEVTEQQRYAPVSKQQKTQHKRRGKGMLSLLLVSQLWRKPKGKGDVVIGGKCEVEVVGHSVVDQALKRIVDGRLSLKVSQLRSEPLARRDTQVGESLRQILDTSETSLRQSRVLPDPDLNSGTIWYQRALCAVPALRVALAVRCSVYAVSAGTLAR
eukprot:IDg7475t1